MDSKTLNIPPEVKQEIEEFASEVERLHRGEVSEDDFKRFRLQQGIYGQRQGGEAQMVRTKLPMGRLTSNQLNCLADFAEKYSNGILHVTTRQDIQFHFVDLKNVPQGLQELSESGITTREACGNTVRNVTACPKSGTCAGEFFDVTPYAKAVSEFLLRHPLTQNLPRKFKISFGGCEGCGLGPIHDIGFNAVVRGENGTSHRGFKVVYGGGLGSSPHAAHPLTDFIPANDILRMCEAIIRLFDKHGDKKNRNKARLKFVFDKLGVEKVKEIYEEEFAALSGKKFPDIDVPAESIPAIPEFSPNTGFDSDKAFLNWKSRNACLQKQDGFYNVQIKLLLGDINNTQAKALSRIASTYAGGIIMTTVNQNLMIPWVKEDAFGVVYAELKKAGLEKAGTEELKDITCCPGSETCNLGITASRGLVEQLSQDVENRYTDSGELDHISIKASGCPNSCGQHHIASIGFHGGAKKINGILAPHYEVLLGGRITDDGVTFGTSVIKIPAKNSPEAVRVLIENYRKEKQENETFPQFFDRKGKLYFNDLLTPLKELPDIESSPHSYIDFGSEQKFSLEDRGQGECAGAVTDMIQDHLSSAERAVFQGKLFIEKGAYADSVRQVNRAVAASARALLVTEGMDFSEDLETLKKFDSLIIDMGIVSEKFADLTSRYQEDPESADKEKAEARLQEAEALIHDSQNAYNKLQSDKSLRIRVGAEDDKNGQKPESASTKTGETLKIDLLGVKCPFNYVKTKLKLETMDLGQKLEVLLDDGEPVKNVPKSVQNDGHKVLSLDKVDGHFKMVVEKV